MVRLRLYHIYITSLVNQNVSVALNMFLCLIKSIFLIVP